MIRDAQGGVLPGATRLERTSDERDPYFLPSLPVGSYMDHHNVLNTANFDLPNRIFGTPNFGRIFSAKDSRQMQFGARVSF